MSSSSTSTSGQKAPRHSIENVLNAIEDAKDKLTSNQYKVLIEHLDDHKKNNMERVEIAVIHSCPIFENNVMILKVSVKYIRVHLACHEIERYKSKLEDKIFPSLPQHLAKLHFPETYMCSYGLEHRLRYVSRCLIVDILD